MKSPVAGFADASHRRKELNMTNYLIGYDLDKPSQNYEELFKAIKSLSGSRGWWHCLDSTWIIQSDLSAAHIRDLLWAHMGASDKLLVTALTRPSAWQGFDEGCNSWLKNNM
jgi:hypothetical protein